MLATTAHAFLLTSCCASPLSRRTLPTSAAISALFNTIRKAELTSSLLGLVTRHCANHRVLLADDAVLGALGIALSARGLVLGLALCVLLLAGLLPGSGTRKIANLSSGNLNERSTE